MDDFNNNYYYSNNDPGQGDPQNSYPYGDLGPELRPKRPKKKGGAGRVIALILVCALVGGAGIGGRAVQ